MRVWVNTNMNVTIVWQHDLTNGNSQSTKKNKVRVLVRKYRLPTVKNADSKEYHITSSKERRKQTQSHVAKHAQSI